MSVPLIDLSTLANHTLTFVQVTKGLGFSSPSEIDRFLFQSYGKTIKQIPPANRPKGAIFFLQPPTNPGSLARIDDLKPVLLQVRRGVSSKFYMLRLDLSGGATVAHSPSASEQKQMTSGAWTMGHAQMVSKQTGQCVVWANGVSATVFLNGDYFIESPDVVEELPAGLPSSFQSLSWDGGEIVFEFAQHELNDTSPAGIWHLADKFLLRPKPEKLMSLGLGKFLRHRMAGYVHHDDEPYVENQGRADLSVVRYNGFIDIVEVKWTGCSLTAAKQLQPEKRIRDALKKNRKGWLTEYDDGTFVAGAKQLAKYFTTGKYQRAYLAVFDCTAPGKKRQNECIAADPAYVAPHSPADFRFLRACVDPRKASKISKGKS